MSTSHQSSIRVGQSGDMPSVLALLQTAGLPTADLASVADLRTWVLDLDDSIRGVIALEGFGTEGLLRSLAVHADYRNCGIGRELVARLERDAREAGVRKLVLLTQTAESFFRSLGFLNIDRSQVGDAMKECAEFRSLCPASAACMAKTLVVPAKGELTHV